MSLDLYLALTRFSMVIISLVRFSMTLIRSIIDQVSPPDWIKS